MTLIKVKENTPILFGADPEAFAVYEKEGKYFTLPPYYFRKFLGVSSEIQADPRHPVFIEGDGYKLHEDGAAFEFSVRPSHNPRDLFDRIQEASRVTSEKILHNFPEDCLPELKFVPTVGFDVERWANMPKDFFMATRFGCDPDEDVYDLQAKVQEIDASKHPERYAGGHIHVSGSKKIAEDPHMAVRCMVISAGLAAIVYTPYPDLEKARTYLYGKPGKFRAQNYGIYNPFGEDYAYGIEYRTLSAVWAGNWGVARHVLRWAEIGIKTLLETGLGEKIHAEIFQPAIEAILSADQPLATELLSYVESKI